MDCLDKTRRSMTDALRTGELTEEGLAFVAGKEPPGHRVSVAAASARPPDSKPAVRRLPKPPTETPIPNAVSDLRPVTMVGAGTVSITVRLPGSLPARLLRASVERKLRREIPFTQQEIVAEALTAWLQQHGYLS